MNKNLKVALFITAFFLLIAGNAYFYFTEKAKQMPELEFTLLDGKKLKVTELKGKTLVLNFWATSCEPCRKEIPELIELDEEFSSKGVKIIGIAMAHDRPDQVIAFKQLYKIPYAIAMDINAAVAKAFDVNVIPVTLLVSPRGQIVYRHSGVINFDDMRKRISGMLPEKRV